MSLKQTQEAGKLDETVSGEHLTVVNKRPKSCHDCKHDFKRNVNNFNINNILSCKACNLVYFFDEDCKSKVGSNIRFYVKVS